MEKLNALKCVGQDDICSLRIICSLARNGQYYLEEVDKYGNTALLKACFLGRMECAQILIDFGARLKATNYFGKRVANSIPDVYSTLNLGQNALTLATHAGHFALVRALLRYRSYDDFNKASIIPALCVATMRRHKQLADFFIGLDANRGKGIHTVHGLGVADIEHMMRKRETQPKAILHMKM